MASPQKENGHIRIANELFDEILKRDFTKRQLSIIFFIIRFSYGCNRKQTLKLKLSNFAQCGIHQCTIKAELKRLKTARVIDHNEDSNTFTLNKNYEQWFINYCAEYDEGKYNNLIKQQLEGIPHKEHEEQKPRNSQQNLNFRNQQETPYPYKYFD